MRVKVIHEFHDKDRFSKVYPVGIVCDFDDERARVLMSLGLVEEDNTSKRGRRKNAEE